MGKKESDVSLSPSKPRTPRKEQTPPVKIECGPTVIVEPVKDISPIGAQDRNHAEFTIAIAIVRAFLYSVIGLCVIALAGTGAAIYRGFDGKMIQDMMHNYFKDGESFLVTVFSPLLSFVLGYYFGRKSHSFNEAK